jgi:type VI secretion system protein ImpL
MTSLPSSSPPAPRLLDTPHPVCNWSTGAVAGLVVWQNAVQGPTDGFLLQTSLFFWAVLLPTLAVFVWLLLLIRGLPHWRHHA